MRGRGEREGGRKRRRGEREREREGKREGGREGGRGGGREGAKRERGLKERRKREDGREENILHVSMYYMYMCYSQILSFKVFLYHVSNIHYMKDNYINRKRSNYASL